MLTESLKGGLEIGLTNLLVLLVQVILLNVTTDNDTTKITSPISLDQQDSAGRLTIPLHIPSPNILTNGRYPYEMDDNGKNCTTDEE
ncbi:hypothetical protein BJ912DRAFT_67029 [Pholiota molesta]|nr:hypothetical protein BJ912DRAFT_67029 [Pholiota molesta]